MEQKNLYNTGPRGCNLSGNISMYMEKHLQRPTTQAEILLTLKTLQTDSVCQFASLGPAPQSDHSALTVCGTGPRLGINEFLDGFPKRFGVSQHIKYK